MQRLYVSLLLAGLCQMLSPTPAQAWWEWLDPLSGPSGLKGPQFEARLVCFGNDLPDDLKRLWSDATNGSAAAQRGDLTWEKAATNWRSAAYSWHRVAILLGAISPQALLDTEAAVRDLSDVKAKADAWEALAIKSRRAIDSTLTSTRSVGVLWSFCSPTKVRRVSIDLGITYLRTDDERFADGKTLKLTTVIPSVSWRVFDDSRYDVVDVGMGGGGYWFSSEGFAPFRGVVLQPWRVDIHAPSSWSSKRVTDPKRWLAVPTLRLGQLLFPAGFEPNAFNAGPGTPAGRIPGELVFTKSFFMNLEPLIRRSPL